MDLRLHGQFLLFTWLALLCGVGSTRAFTFAGEPAADFQPYFLDQPHGPYIGGDIATSIPIPTTANPHRVLWLFGDTFTGSTKANGSRIIDAMPRNSVGLINVSSDGKIMGQLEHFIRVNKQQAQHAGYFTPPASVPDQWYWPTAGCYIQGTVFVFAQRMGPHPGPLFPFATVAIDVLALRDTADNNALNWAVQQSVSMPYVNNTFVLSSAVSVNDDGYVYLLGGSGDSNARAILSRMPTPDLVQLSFARLEFLDLSKQWSPFSPALDLATLFASGPSEATLQFHPFLQLWFVVIVNTFQSSSVSIRLAPAIVGPWSDAVAVFAIPPAFLQGGFCYAGKAHPEMMASRAAPEIILTFMCNTPSVGGIVNRPDMYVPRVVRVHIAGGPHGDVQVQRMSAPWT